MALFSLTDIGFKTDTRSGVGVNNLLENSEYNRSLLRYPKDLGQADRGHYIVFNINEQINTAQEFRGKEVSDKPTVHKNIEKLTDQFGLFTTTQTIQNGIALGGKAINAAASFLERKIGINFTQSDIWQTGKGFANAASANVDGKIGIRTIRRIADTIALYMPDTLAFSYNQNYDQLNPGREGLQALASGLATASGSVRSGGNPESVVNALAPFLGAYVLRNAGDFGKVLFTAGTGGKVNNPMMEILYSSPEFRSFKFDFMMYPRDSKEALEVQNILQKLRFHQAPELVKGTGGYFMYPPSEFDISFYYNGQVNPNLPKIGTCVLTNIDVDYAPNGWHAYEMPDSLRPEKGKTGMPVAIRLSLSFKETEYLVKGSPLLDLMR